MEESVSEPRTTGRETGGTETAVKSAHPKALIALILTLAASLMACGGNEPGPMPGGAANSAISSTAQSSGTVQAVSLSMDDYLGNTVVLYFSFPG